MSTCPACGTPAAPYSLPVAQDGVQTGTVIMQPVPEGYECRWYKLPASLPPGMHTIPMERLEFLYGGLYGKDRNLIRPLGPATG